jgi:GGDEF domain-containing protein
MSMDATTLAESALRRAGARLAQRDARRGRARPARAGIVGIVEGRIEYIDRVASSPWTLRRAHAPGRDVLVLRDPATNCDGSDEPGLKGALRTWSDAHREVPVFPRRGPGRSRGRRVVVLRDATAECGWQLSFDAQHDSLTELLNRASFEAESQQPRPAKAGTSRAPISSSISSSSSTTPVAILPATRCCAVSRRSRPTAFAGATCRAIGDEFVVLLRRCSIENAIETARRCASIAAYRFSWYGRRCASPPVSVSSKSPRRARASRRR